MTLVSGSGGELLVRAVTHGPGGERLPGNFPEYQLMPDESPRRRCAGARAP
ncbi:hypothetical protein [Streptomyces sp. AP-93]|uniref:hypothetical protein n=1 Tax=Streptomyces sp. AP-93 TaxID=2929048 RepID=UPI001FAF0DE0|nr:hypothetical protein [Streptomyces sp. AP-93]MCJ0874427.1 hypothetical protein [Streptomyces sp. AP-93]